MYLSKIMFFTLLFVAAASTEFEVNNGTSIEELLKYYEDIHIAAAEEYKLCRSASVNNLLIPNWKEKTISIIFELSDSKFKHCFTYFKIYLKQKRKVVDSAMIPFNYDVQKKGYHVFENVTCGSYYIGIEPFYSNWQSSNVVLRPDKMLNMSSMDCRRTTPQELAGDGDAMRTVLLLLSLLCVFQLMLIVGGFAYYQFCFKKQPEVISPEKQPLIDPMGNLSPVSSKGLAKKLEVIILNRSDDATTERVKRLVQILSPVPNLEISDIGDYLYLQLVDYSLIIEKLRRSSTDDVIKKIIIVDSVGKATPGQNENENDCFQMAIKILSMDVSRNIDDFSNLFVVHFGKTFTRLNVTELECIVNGVRYRVPDHLEALCQTLILGSQIKLTNFYKSPSELAEEWKLYELAARGQEENQRLQLYDAVEA